MKYWYPDYYKKFQCVAGACKDTCCAGWQIVIDEKSKERYRNEKSEYRQVLYSNIDWQEGVFCQDKQGRCAFLNEKNLCAMYENLGENSLCDTCTMYPRHMEEFENVREYTLSLSCPEVAMDLMNRKEIVTFLTEEDDIYEEYEEFDLLLYEILLDTRELLLDISRERTIDIGIRMQILWRIASEMQNMLDEGQIFEWSEHASVYKSKQFLEEFQKKQEINYDFILKIYQSLYRLELLKEDWGEMIDTIALSVFGKGPDVFYQQMNTFHKWLEKNMSVWSVQMEQLLVYFISTYFCGAVYDGYVDTKVKTAVSCGVLIYVILCGIWSMNEQKLTNEDVVKIVYRFSRELEHSDINMEELENYLSEI